MLSYYQAGKLATSSALIMTMLAIQYSLLCFRRRRDVQLYTNTFYSSQPGSCYNNPA